MALSQEDKERYRQRLLAKGQVVAKKLADLLAGKDVTLGELADTQGDDPAMSKEDRLRAFLDLLTERRNAIDKGTFGICQECGEPIPNVELDQMPWANRCLSCASTNE